MNMAIHEWAKVFLSDATLKAVHYTEVVTLADDVFKAIETAQRAGHHPIGVLMPIGREHVARAGLLLSPHTFTANAFDALLVSNFPLFVGDVEKVVAIHAATRRLPVFIGY
jgi:hypothetical protein